MTSNFRIDSVGHDKTHGVDYVPKNYKFNHFYPEAPIELVTKDDVIAAYYAQLMRQADLMQDDAQRIAELEGALLQLERILTYDDNYSGADMLVVIKKALGETK